MRLQNKKVIALVDDAFEDLEHWYPVYRLREEGAQVDLVGPEANAVYEGKHGVPAKTDYAFSDIDSKNYDAILVPGGWAPDKLRRYPEVIQFIQDMDKANKPIAQICHAGWVLISANILKGRKVTSTPGIKDDMINAGSEWTNEEVIVDGNIISSRSPKDLPAYGKAIADKIAE